MKAKYLLAGGLGAALVAAVLCEAPPATAFPFINSWHLASSGNNPNRCGADGIYGTGGPTDFGITCKDCHIDAQAAFVVDIDVSPPFQQSGNDRIYVPGQTYDIQISIQGEVHTMNPSGGPTLNGFAASFEAADGAQMGTLVASQGRSDACPPSAPTDPMNQHNRTIVYGDCHAVLFEPEHDDTWWAFQWIAPAAGAGDLSLFYAVVDGDHTGESSLGDDTVVGKWNLIEE
jgi:hypothetical protein